MGRLRAMGYFNRRNGWFYKAVEAVHAWVEANSNWNETLLIVVPDHDTGFVWGPNSSRMEIQLYLMRLLIMEKASFGI
jgi:hypothetical protein